ncbi:MAG: FtsW/RodA/SpoVE family cell cycle protein, partial [Planctomycetes bacterium]|nr:FtsW/RodA/SpoVE family cell cycle protein [Planctomycetota bacterium]
GKGLGMGMVKRGFLPEDSTDFLFAILCEEWGLIGAAALIMVLLMYLLLSHRAASEASDKFGRVLAGSLGFLIVLQAAMHIAVNVGFLPPTGISMPFVSAGGTSLILAAIATSLIVSVTSRSQGRAGAPMLD